MPTTDDPQALTAHLADRDVPCPACGYNLRGLTSQHCPECRHQIVLSVALAEPPMVSFVLAALGLAACGIAAGVLFVAVIFLSITSNGFPRREAAIIVLWIPGAIVAIDAAAVAWFLSPGARRWFRTLPQSDRYRVTLGFWGVSLACFAVWLVGVINM